MGGLVLAAVGLPFDDAMAADYSDLASPRLIAELTFTAGPTKNDLALLTEFPYLPTPHRGFDYVTQQTANFSSPVLDVGGGLGIGVPKEFILDQNYPNPFNPATVISYKVSKAGNVKLKVFDALGREVTTLVDQQQNPGVYKISWNASNLASGNYFYRLLVDNEVLTTKKAVLLK